MLTRRGFLTAASALPFVSTRARADYPARKKIAIITTVWAHRHDVIAHVLIRADSTATPWNVRWVSVGIG